MQARPLGWEDPLEEGLATTLVFLPRESREQRSLWATVCRIAKSDTTEMTACMHKLLLED